MTNKVTHRSRKTDRNPPRRSASRKLLLESLERRELMAANAFGATIPGNGLNTGGIVGGGTPQTFFEVEPNNLRTAPQLVPLGTSAGQATSIDLTGSVAVGSTTTPSDADFFALQLRAGDVLDISLSGAAASLDMYDPDGRYRESSVQNIVTANDIIGRTYPIESPLQTTGNAILSTVITQDGTYVIRIGSDQLIIAGPPRVVIPPQSGSYTANMRVYRPILENQPVGTKQRLFIDFDGEILNRNEIDPTGIGIARISPLADFLQGLRLNPADEDRLITKTMERIELNFREIARTGVNGDFDTSGIPGDFGIELLNSRDHADPWGQDHVSRILVGGTQVQLGVNTIGLASSIDVGNFDTTETAIVLMDLLSSGLLAAAVPLGGGASLLDLAAVAIGNIVTHEAAHFFGLWHTNNANAAYNLIDSGGNFLGLVGAGSNGIFEGGIDILNAQGLLIEQQPRFIRDQYAPLEGFLGFQDSLNRMSVSLPTGKVGGAITGRVFNDTNRNGTFNNGELGIAGATVFADRNGNGLLDAGESNTLTSADGTYSLPAVAGTYNIVLALPLGTQASGPSTRPVTVVAGQGVTDVNFGTAPLLAQTGNVFSDVNNNGIQDPGETGLSNIYVYVDLNNDGKPGLNEPFARSSATGAYSLSFPAPGNYTVRQVVPSGFVQTSPANNAGHSVTFTGTPLTANFNFGNRPSNDWGDAPTQYGSASHGIVSGLSLGTLIDEDARQQSSTDARGDDTNGVDDEDGVVQLNQLARGEIGRLQITTTNTTGAAACLHAWIDFNGDGVWAANEQIITNLILGTQNSYIAEFLVPQNAVGLLNARFRYAYPANLPATGHVESGEVEDYQFLVLATGNTQAAVADFYSVGVNSNANILPVLENDFNFTPLTITQVGTIGTQGVVEISSDRRNIVYTPPAGFRGRTTFTYVVNAPQIAELPIAQRTATVTIDVQFQSTNGLAIDDSFDIAEGSLNVPLDVLANDVPAASGQLTVASVRMISGNGAVRTAPGGTAVIYSAPFGSSGTEQFEYVLSDGAGGISTAIGTVHLIPGSRLQDVVAFDIFPVSAATGQRISVIPVGQPFDLEVRVRDLRSGIGLLGVGSAYLDVLYSAQLVSPQLVTNDLLSQRIGATVSFVPDFINAITGDASLPGILNEIGGTQDNPPEGDTDLRVFRIRMKADSPGVAKFVGDPADDPFSEVSLISPPGKLNLQQIQYNGSSLTIIPVGGDFAFAKDDNFLSPISNSTATSLNVLANDNPGPSGTIKIISVTPAANGQVSIDTKGTSNPADDEITYSPNANPNPNNSYTDSFTYTIQSLNGELSTASVTVQVGTNTAQDDVVLVDLAITGMDGVTPVSTLNVGETFKLVVSVRDLRPNPVPSALNDRRGVFAAFADIIFDQRLATVSTAKAAQDSQSNLVTDASLLGFDIDFAQPWDSGVISGDVLVPGVINDVGSQQTSDGTQPPITHPFPQTGLLKHYEITLRAGTRAGNLTFIADPAFENLPFTESLLYEAPAVNAGQTTPERARLGQIRFTAKSVQIVSPLPEFTNPVNSLDVNDDGGVTPVDALIIINQLNSSGSRSFASGESASFFKAYVDVNADNALTPIDALSVINYLNKFVSAGSGEASTASTTAVTHESPNGSGVSAESSARIAFASNEAALAASLGWLASGDDSDEEDDDLLDDLALDIAGL